MSDSILLSPDMSCCLYDYLDGVLTELAVEIADMANIALKDSSCVTKVAKIVELCGYYDVTKRLRGVIEWKDPMSEPGAHGWPEVEIGLDIYRLPLKYVIELALRDERRKLRDLDGFRLSRQEKRERREISGRVAALGWLLRDANQASTADES